MDRSEGHIVDIELPVPDNPAWEDFKFELLSTDQMDADSWDTFIGAEIKTLKARGD